MNEPITTPVKSIRAYCIACQGGSLVGVRTCQLQNCPLYRFRMGRNPARKGIAPNAGVLNRKSEDDSMKIYQKGQLNEQ